MSDLKYWSSDANNNNASSPDGISANEPIKNIDNWGREVMAATKRAYLDREWIDNNHIPTYVSSNSFSVETDLTAIYTINRRVRLIDSVGNIIYGTITASSYSDPNTTITLALDSTQLNASINQVAYATVTNLSLNVYNKDEVYTKDEVNTQVTNVIGKKINIQYVDPVSIRLTEGIFTFDDYSGQATLPTIIKRINANWVEGDGNGALDVNSATAYTWYHIFAIHNPTDNKSDVIFSLDFNNPALPSGYTKKAYIWSIKTATSPSAIYTFQQVGNYNQWTDFPINQSNVSDTWAYRSIQSPYGFKCITKIMVSGNESALRYSPSGNANFYLSFGGNAIGSFGDEHHSFWQDATVTTNDQSQIFCRGISFQYGGRPEITTQGWFNPFY